MCPIPLVGYWDPEVDVAFMRVRGVQVYPLSRFCVPPITLLCTPYHAFFREDALTPLYAAKCSCEGNILHPFRSRLIRIIPCASISSQYFFAFSHSRLGFVSVACGIHAAIRSFLDRTGYLSAAGLSSRSP